MTYHPGQNAPAQAVRGVRRCEIKGVCDENTISVISSLYRWKEKIINRLYKRIKKTGAQAPVSGS
jgi:hypothetical protein